MRAREFIREFTVNVPVTINIPLKDLDQSTTTDVVNPGVRYGEDDHAKWSPPLQQHLDTMKDGVGPTLPDVVDKPLEMPAVKRSTHTVKPNPSTMGIFGPRPSTPG